DFSDEQFVVSEKGDAQCTVRNVVKNKYQPKCGSVKLVAFRWMVLGNCSRLAIFRQLLTKKIVSLANLRAVKVCVRESCCYLFVWCRCLCMGLLVSRSSPCPPCF